MKFSFDNNTITALSTVCLVLVGYAQLKLLFAQKRQSQLTFVQYYREQWTQNKDNLGLMIYIGRDENEYYQLMNQARLKELSNLKIIHLIHIRLLGHLRQLDKFLAY